MLGPIAGQGGEDFETIAPRDSEAGIIIGASRVEAAGGRARKGWAKRGTLQGASTLRRRPDSGGPAVSGGGGSHGDAAAADDGMQGAEQVLLLLLRALIVVMLTLQVVAIVRSP